MITLSATVCQRAGSAKTDPPAGPFACPSHRNRLRVPIGHAVCARLPIPSIIGRSMERDFIQRLRHRLPPSGAWHVGLGDDAAVLDWSSPWLPVVTTDVITDQVDFRLEEADPRLVGRKALAVNLSDLAAMAAEPVACVVGLVLPRLGGQRIAEELYEGITALAGEFQIPIVGGDTNTWDGPLCISITAIGRVEPGRPLRRNGAQAGDRIVVSGELGGSILGHHFTFSPRVSEARTLADNYIVHAGIDISDGLAVDLWHLLEESRCGAVVWADRVPVSEAAKELARREGQPGRALAHALGDGEDFELILAVPPEEARRMIEQCPIAARLTEIGEFIPGNDAWLETGGRREPLTRSGFEHNMD